MKVVGNAITGTPTIFHLLMNLHSSGIIMDLKRTGGLFNYQQVDRPR